MNRAAIVGDEKLIGKVVRVGLFGRVADPIRAQLRETTL